MNDPSFIIIGAMRCGTTSLYNYVVRHPDIMPNKLRKEIHFFDKNKRYNRGIRHYRKHFPSGFTGEATPMYIYKSSVPKRIHEHFPDVKMIAVLRNPVERFVSHWSLSRRRGYDKREFREVVKDVLANPRGRKTYAAKGMYAEQLQRYFDLFDRSQILILQSSKLFSDPSKEMQKVFKFCC